VSGEHNNFALPGPRAARTRDLLFNEMLVAEKQVPDGLFAASGMATGIESCG